MVPWGFQGKSGPKNGLSRSCVTNDPGCSAARFQGAKAGAALLVPNSWVQAFESPWCSGDARLGDGILPGRTQALAEADPSLGVSLRGSVRSSRSRPGASHRIPEPRLSLDEQHACALAPLSA